MWRNFCLTHLFYLLPKAWCKNITNKLLQNFGSITPMHERCSSLEIHPSNSPLENIQGIVLGHFSLF
jgi:hypothetical protein